VAIDPRRARDLHLLDKVDAHPRRTFDGTLWRVSREGRDPLQGGRSTSRWCNGEFDVLYTSLERDGALAEVHALLALQPVFPSRISFLVHTLKVASQSVLHLADLPLLEQLGVDTARYQDRDYRQTQDIADAAFFLGFHGLVVPSARWSCANAVLFTDRVDPAALVVEATDSDPVNWSKWRGRHRGRRIT
jgi:RES domain-containing protein